MVFVPLSLVGCLSIKHLEPPSFSEIPEPSQSVLSKQSQRFFTVPILLNPYCLLHWWSLPP